jgi:hypothetical protein
MTARHLALLALAALVGACADGPPAASLTLRAVDSPAGPDSGEPFLASDGSAVYMSWLQRAEQGGHDLLFARYVEGAWSAPRAIARSDRFFVNWADVPSIVRGPDGALWAHWLERGEVGGYDYGVRIARSADDGVTWSAPWTPHDDGTATEHGFATSVPVGGDLGYLWLDGRGFSDGPAGEPLTNQTALYYRTMGSSGPSSAEVMVDARVCDCCQTDAALTARGPIVAYRDRNPDEIRDIYVTRLVAGSWTEGMLIHEDKWQTGSCPINGPAVAAQGENVAVAWFSNAWEVPLVKVAFSTNGGESFEIPTGVDSGNPSGRVDLLMSEDGSVLVIWLERTGGDFAEVQMRHVTPRGRLGEVLRVSSASQRASGFPRMVTTPGGEILVAWTDGSDATPAVRVSAIDVVVQ